jgi:hypothetical protein
MALGLMRTLRLVVIFVTLLSLPAYGLGTAVDARECPAKSQAAAGMTMDDRMMAGDCCAEKDGQKPPCESPESGSACGTCSATHNCKSPQPFEAGRGLGVSVAPIRQLPVESSRFFSVYDSPLGLFRPPALI